ncbi:MAG: hypothetical protein ACR2PL_10785, partial [Dehalococcoidia bacterium]
MAEESTKSNLPGEPRSPEGQADGTSSEAQPNSDQDTAETSLPDVLPVLMSGPNVMYPAIVVPLISGEENEVRVVDDAVSSGNRMLAVFAQQPDESGGYGGQPQP